jgi:hypothetical protein
MNNLNKEIVHASKNLKTNINTTIGKRHPTNMKGSPINTYTLRVIPVHKGFPKNPIPLKEKPTNPQMSGSQEYRLLKRIKKSVDDIDHEMGQPSRSFFGLLSTFDTKRNKDRLKAKIGRQTAFGGASRKKTKTRKNRKKIKTRKRKQKIEKTKQTKKSHYIP